MVAIQTNDFSPDMRKNGDNIQYRIPTKITLTLTCICWNSYQLLLSVENSDIITVHIKCYYCCSYYDYYNYYDYYYF